MQYVQLNDGNKIPAVGLGYTLKAAQTDKRLKAVATLSAFNSGIVRKNDFMMDYSQESGQKIRQKKNI